MRESVRCRRIGEASVLRAETHRGELGDTDPLLSPEQRYFRDAQISRQRDRDLEMRNPDERFLLVHRKRAGPDLDHDVRIRPTRREAGAAPKTLPADGPEGVFSVASPETKRHHKDLRSH